MSILLTLYVNTIQCICKTVKRFESKIKWRDDCLKC